MISSTSAASPRPSPAPPLRFADLVDRLLANADWDNPVPNRSDNTGKDGVAVEMPQCAYLPQYITGVASVTLLGVPVDAIRLRPSQIWESSGWSRVDPYTMVYLAATPGSVREDALLLHELTHHVQWLRGHSYRHRAGRPGPYDPTYSTEELCDWSGVNARPLIRAADEILAQWANPRALTDFQAAVAAALADAE